jgi:hypothetical protein
VLDGRPRARGASTLGAASAGPPTPAGDTGVGGRVSRCGAARWERDAAPHRAGSVPRRVDGGLERIPFRVGSGVPARTSAHPGGCTTPEVVVLLRRGKARYGVLKVHRILPRALKIAVRRGHVAQNVATLVDAPSVPFVERSRSTSTRRARCSPRRPSCGTAPAGRSASPWVCAKARRSACAGPTSTGPPAASTPTR